MKQFNLEEYLANPNRKVVTGDGRNVRIICTDSKIRHYPIIALVEEPNRSENLFSYTEGGQMVSYGTSENYDLFFAPEKHERWAIIYKRPLTGSFEIWPGIYADREKAERIREVNLVGAKCSVIKIEWEEEQ